MRDPRQAASSLERARGWQPLSARVASALAILATLLIAFNAVVYTALNSTVVVISDSWYFVDAFLRPAYRKGLSLPLLLAKRNALDHAAPLQKLLLFADARWLGLDLRFEALFALLLGLVTLGMLGYWMRRARPVSGPDPWASLALATLTAAYLSMNSTVVFEWSLVTLYFLPILLAMLFIAAVARAMEGASLLVTALAAFACLLLADDVGLLALGATLLMVAGGYRRGRIDRARTLRLGACLLLALLASRGLYLVFSNAAGQVPVPSMATRVLAILALGPLGLLKALVIVASAPIVHRAQLGAASDTLQPLQVGAALVVLGMHAWFWMSQRLSQPTFLGRFAFALMLFAYLLVAGIVYGRISDFGLDYLNAPRYVVLYAVMLLAIILQLHVAIGEQVPTRRMVAKGLLLLLALVVVGPQAHYAQVAWRRAPSVAGYQRTLAQDMGEAARGNADGPLQCLPQMQLCRMPDKQRQRVVQFMRTEQLNVFGARVQALYGLSPARPATTP